MSESAILILQFFSLWDMSKPDSEAFIEQANLHHPTIEFTAETFDTETAFLDTVVYKLRHKIHGKIYPWCTLQTLKKELSKEKPWESFEKNSSETAFEENNSIF